MLRVERILFSCCLYASSTSIAYSTTGWNLSGFDLFILLAGLIIGPLCIFGIVVYLLLAISKSFIFVRHITSGNENKETADRDNGRSVKASVWYQRFFHGYITLIAVHPLLFLFINHLQGGDGLKGVPMGPVFAFGYSIVSLFIYTGGPVLLGLFFIAKRKTDRALGNSFWGLHDHNKQHQ
jgi:hypothetical protein